MDRPPRGGKAVGVAGVLVLVAVLCLGISSSLASAKKPKLPKGAEKVAGKDYGKKVIPFGKGVWCAKPSRRWRSFLPAKEIVIRRGGRYSYFVSFSRLARNTKSIKKKKRFKATHRRFSKRCKSINSLRFSIRKAVGIARTQKRRGGSGKRSVSEETGNLQALLPSGSIRDAITRGEAKVRAIQVGSDGEVFIWLAEPITLTNGIGTFTFTSPYEITEPARCMFLKVERATGVPVCLDRTLMLEDGEGNAMAPNVQVGTDGAIYYRGFGYCFTDPEDREADTLCPIARYLGPGLRRWFGWWFGKSGDLGSLVLASGSAFIGLRGVDWLLRMTPNPGDMSTPGESFQQDAVPFVIPQDAYPLDPGETYSSSPLTFSDTSNPGGVFWLSKFPDGNLYFGLRATTPPFWPRPTTANWISRFITSEDKMDPNPWIGSTPTSTHNTTALCSGSQAPKTFCADAGTSIKDQFSTPGGSHYLISGSGPEGDLIKVFPRLSAPPTAVARISVATNAGERILLAGEDENGQDILTMLDPITNAEKILLGPGSGIKITQLQVASSGQGAFFAGQRSPDGRNVLGRVDLATDTASIVGELESEWLDFQTFGSG